MKALVLAAATLLPALLLPTAACAQEIVEVSTRLGVTQSFFIADMGESRPRAIALLYVGGAGVINLRRQQGTIRYREGNFLPRSRREFIRNGVLPVIMDAPSDQRSGLTDLYRASADQSEDARGAVWELKRRYPGLPVFIVGTSRGTITAAFVGRDLGAQVAGVVLTSSLFGAGGRRGAGSLGGFDYESIKTPLLFVHHRDDACPQTPYAAAAELGRRYELISVTGGNPPESGPCEALAPHGYYGVETRVVDAIAAWMLKRPYPKEIR